MKRRIKRTISHVLLTAFAIGCFVGITSNNYVYAADSQFQPITVTGFNEDLIAENTDGNSASTSTTVCFDNYEAGSNNVMYSVDFRGPLNLSSAPPYGLPSDGVINSDQNSGVSYQLEPYNESNTLLLINQNEAGTLTLKTSGAYEKIIVLASSAQDSSDFDVTLNFNDGTHIDTSFTTPDWYNGTGYAVKGIGRVARTSDFDADGTFTGDTNNPRLYDCFIDNSAQKTKLLTSISVTKTSATGRTAILAVAGQKSAGSPTTPIVKSATGITGLSFEANWEAVAGATSYYLDVATDADFTNLINSYNNLDTGDVTTYNVAGLDIDSTYYYRVRAVNTNGVSFSSSTSTVTTASDDATISTILSQAITVGSEAGTSGDPKTASISVSNSVSFVTESDIVKNDAGATVSFYGTDSTFSAIESGSVNLTAGTETIVYIKITAKNGTELYYHITINREGNYIVTFDSKGGSTVSDQTNATTGSTVTAPESPTKTGYTFGGWYKEDTCTNVWNFSTDTVFGNTTLYAKWTVNSYSVTFNSKGGSAVENKTVDYNTTVTAPESPTKSGYTFGGWYKEDACTNVWNFSTDTVVGNTNLYAKWTVNSYSATFNSNEGSAVESKAVDFNAVITAPESPTKTGYTFGGWYKNSELTEAYNFNDTVTSNITLYAKWIKNSTGFLPFHLKATGGSTSQTLSFATISDADGYYIYLAKCNYDGKKYTLKKIADLGSEISSYKATKLKKDTYYKMQIKAYKIVDGKKIVFAVSNVLHSTTTSKVYANPTKVTSSNSEVKVKKGATKQLESNIALPNGMNMDEHTELISYVSSNESIATVSSSGKVKAISKGSCEIYAYAQNGVYKKIKITVK